MQSFLACATVSRSVLSAGRMLDTMRVAILFFALLAAIAVGDDPCDSTAPPAPAPAPTPGCADKPGDWKSSIGSTCADYVSKSYCTADGGYGSGWDKSTDGSFDDWAVNGVAANVACCGCGGGSTVTGKQACQGHSYDEATCAAVGCCRWNILLGCRANDADAQCFSAAPGTTASGNGKGKKVLGGLIAGGVIAGAIGAAAMGKRTTTAGPGPDTTTSVTQGAQNVTSAAPAVTTTTQNSSSSLLWLWILLGILALCCCLALCAGLASMLGGKKKKKKSKRATTVSQSPPLAPAELPIVEEQEELLPLVPPLLEPYPMTPMAAPLMVETVQMVPTATPTMVETAVPMAMPAMQMGAPAVSMMPTMGAPAMQGVGGFGAQVMPAMGGGGFGTQAMPGLLV